MLLEPVMVTFSANCAALFGYGRLSTSYANCKSSNSLGPYAIEPQKFID